MMCGGLRSDLAFNNEACLLKQIISLCTASGVDRLAMSQCLLNMKPGQVDS